MKRRKTNKVYVVSDKGFSAWKRTARQAVTVALSECAQSGTEVSVLLTGNARMRELNLAYRRMDKPTDVLSFPSGEEVFLGDVAVSIEKARSQAKEFGVSVREELLRLLTHGTLHLLGYDHVKGGAQARKMKKKEEEVLLAIKTKPAKRK